MEEMSRREVKEMFGPTFEICYICGMIYDSRSTANVPPYDCVCDDCYELLGKEDGKTV